MARILKKLFDIRSGEVSRALLMFSYIFLVICTLLVLKPVRSSLFLDKFHAAQLPYVFIMVGLTALLVSIFYTPYAQRVPLRVLIRTSLLLILANLAIFWGLLYAQVGGDWFVYVFYIWVAIFGVVATSQFWILANYVFDARESKRIFGFLAVGGISGGIFGGYLTNLATLIGTRNLLLLCILFIAICLYLLERVWHLRVRDQQVTTATSGAEKGDAGEGIVSLLKKSRHIRYLAGIVGVSVMVASLVDYQYNAIVEASISNTDSRTAFFGVWLSNLSIISLSIQLFLTRRVLAHFGVGPTLFFLPGGLLAGALAIFVAPVLWAGVLVKVVDGAFKQSINKSGMELLALPIPSSVKAQAKAFTDVFVDSFATGFAGILLIVCLSLLGMQVGEISILVVALIVIWMVFIIGIRGAYVQAFRQAIEKRTIDPEELNVSPDDISVFDNLLTVLESHRC